MIGLFTLAVISTAFMFVYWFSGGRSQSGLKSYRVVFSSSVSGLSRGSRVLFNGLAVGEVTRIELVKDDPGKVAAQIDIDANTPVTEDTKLRLESQGLTGVASIAMTGGRPGSKPLALEGGRMPVLNADSSDFQNVLEALQKIAGKADATLGKLDQLIADNAGPISNTIRNVEKFSGALAENADGVKAFMSSISSIGKSIEPVIASIEKLTQDVNVRVAAVDPARIKSIMANADSLAEQLRGSATKLDKVLGTADNLLGSGDTKSVIAEISEAAKAFRVLSQNLDKRTKELMAGLKQFTGPGLRQYEALATDGRRTLEQLNRAVRSIERNPQQFIFGAKPAIPEYSGR